MVGSIPIPNTRFYLTSVDGKKWIITEYYRTAPFNPKNETWCCTIKVDIENSKGQYIEKDKQEATKDGSESTKIQHGI